MESLIVKMYSNGYLQISGLKYAVTDKGKAVLKTFMERYSEYLKLYDVFSYVDLGQGEFAFSMFFEKSDEDWKNYISDERWEDVRIAVAEYKKMNPIEIVFMSFINEGRFNLEANGWQFDIFSGLIWKDIEDICNAALSVEQINQGDESIMPDIIKQGAQLSIDLIKHEYELEEKQKQEQAEQLQQEQAEQVETEVETEVEVTYKYDYPYSYYEPYYEPYYVRPIWLTPLFIW